MQHINIIKICCLHHKQHSATILQLFMKYNRHIKEHVKSKKLAENLSYFFFWRVYICAFCLHINKFFFVHTYDLKAFRNQILCTGDNFFIFKIFNFDLPSKMSKKFIFIFTNTFVAQQFFNKCCPKFFCEFFINVSTSKIFFMLIVFPQKKIKTFKAVAKITRGYAGDL